MPSFQLALSDGFKDDYQKKPSDVQSELDDVLRFLRTSGPSHRSLHSHKVQRDPAKRNEGVQVWESYITWSHRLTWNYLPNFTIYLRATDGHEILPR